MTALDQARKSSDREQTALLQAHESLKSEKAAAAKAIRSAERENYMLDLMTDASQDMAGALPFSLQTKLSFLIQPLTMFFFFVIGSFLDTAAEEQRVNLRVGSLTRLAKEANVDFWADETRCRRIVQFQDRATQTRVFIDLCRDTLGMVYKTMFPRNPLPEEFTDLIEKFKNVQAVHDLSLIHI